MKTATVTITGSEEIVTAGDKKFRVVLVPCEEEKPEYVRSIGDYGELNHGITPGLYKVHRWTEEGCPVLLNNSGEEVKVEEFKPATALEYYTQEAKKRGFKKGVKFKSKCSGIFQITNDNFYFRKNQPHQLIFAEGQGIICDTSTDTWAEIVKDEVEFIPGRLYEYKDDNNHIVVKCSSEKGQMKGCFAGMVVKEISKSMYHDGYYCNNWAMVDFHPYTGTITIGGDQ